MLGRQIGSYRIVEQLGQGGMAVVYRAQHPWIGRQVAIKVLRPELCREAAVTARFLQEARTQAMIAHPGVIEVYDFGCDGSGCYIVMELAEGESLASLLGRHGRLHWRAASELARGLAGALAAAHDVGIIHRDLKPANVLLVADATSPFGLRPKLLDFGVAKLASGSLRTGYADLLGTPRYMAPEQCRDASRVDARADVYALGCVLYEMVCGRPPFAGASLGELIQAHLTLVPPAPRQLVPDLPPALDHVICRALAKYPGERPASMAEVARLLI